MTHVHSSGAGKAGPTTAEPPFVLAHFSDPHISNMKSIGIRDLLSKRIYGYLRWRLHRGTEHSGAVLAALLEDLRQQRPDHVAITGDLTHLSLPIEFESVEKWLRSIGSHHQVTVIPGNHDAYVRTEWEPTHAHWTAYMLSDNVPTPSGPSGGLDSVFPSWRIRGPIALIGVSTARPSAPYLAIGSIGSRQLEKLERIMAQAARQKLFRVILIHHPPAAGTVSWRKRLTDADKFRSLLKQYGADLILHGHAHRAARSRLPVAAGKAPVVGAPSASAVGRNHARRARYYLYRISPSGRGWNVGLRVRIYSPAENAFVTETEEQLVK